MQWTSSSDNNGNKAIHVTVPTNTKFLPAQVESTSERYTRYWKEAVQAIAKAVGTDTLSHKAGEDFEYILIEGHEGFKALILPPEHLKYKLRDTKKYPNGIVEGYSTIINQGASYEPKKQKKPTISSLMDYYKYQPIIPGEGSFQIT